MSNIVHLDYVWIDGQTPSKIRSKTKVLCLNKNQEDHLELPIEKWNFDGSSTNQATTADSERLLVPARLYQSSPTHYILLCEVCYPDSKPHETNHRAILRNTLESTAEDNPHLWLGFEQEYFLKKEGKNIFWPESGVPLNDDRYYCGSGGDAVGFRNMIRRHATLCNTMGIEIVGYNAEVAPGQWEYQCFSQDALKACDDLWISRYLLTLLAEEHEVGVDFSPKPHDGWNGSGCHTNFSTDKSRSGERGKQYFEEIFQKMEKAHVETMKNYGEGNRARLVGAYETSSYDNFNWGVASRSASVRVPNAVKEAGWKGYLEDRRVSSNCDPYKVTTQLLQFV